MDGNFEVRFWLKKPNGGQENLERIIITNPKIDKSEKFAWGYRYVCEIYLSDIKSKIPIYSINPIDNLYQAMEFAKVYLQTLVKNGSVISEVESKETWNLEGLSDSYLQDRINEVKNNPNISQEEKERILGIVKESFGGEFSPIKDQINKLV